jgi:hypothetical protein
VIVDSIREIEDKSIMASPRKRTRRPSVTPIAQPATSAAAPAPATPSRSTPRSDKVNWDEEYHYVIRDVRQLLLISGVLFAGMLAIGYFI